MIGLQTAEFLINTITFLISYIIIATAANIFRTWIALKCGDDTAARSGFLTLNPLQHIDPIGLLCLFLFNLGWPRRIPVNPHNIEYPGKKSKLFAIYFSDIFAHIVLSISGILVLIMLFDINILYAVGRFATRDIVSHLDIAQMYPQAHTLTIVVGYICMVFVYLNTLLAVIHTFINSAYYAMAAYPEQSARLFNQPFVTMVLLLIIIYLFSPAVRFFTVWLIMSTGLSIAQMLGIG